MAAVLTASDAAEVMLRASDPHMAVVFVALVVLGFGLFSVLGFGEGKRVNEKVYPYLGLGYDSTRYISRAGRCISVYVDLVGMIVDRYTYLAQKT